jgi:hypothetical protein
VQRGRRLAALQRLQMTQGGHIQQTDSLPSTETINALRGARSTAFALPRKARTGIGGVAILSQVLLVRRKINKTLSQNSGGDAAYADAGRQLVSGRIGQYKKPSIDKDLKKVERLEEATRTVSRAWAALGLAVLFLAVAGILASLQVGAAQSSIIVIAAAVIGGYMALTI